MVRVLLYDEVFTRKTVVFPSWTDKCQICTLCENKVKNRDNGYLSVIKEL